MISEGRLHDGLFSRLVPDCPPLTAQCLLIATQLDV
jgi:hypothetical protein